MKHALRLIPVLIIASACSAPLVPEPPPEAAVSAVGPAAPVPSSLRIVAWNLEHLAEEDGSGCRPRTGDDYARLAAYAAQLDADVVAFQEVETARAAARVFSPDTYDIVIEEREGSRRGPPCYGLDGAFLNRQATGFAVRKGLLVERHPDVSALQLDNPNLRSGVDITVSGPGGSPVRLMSVHLKSGCAGGRRGDDCDTLARQAEALEDWIEARAAEGGRFAVLGDFNRRLAREGDAIWEVLDGPAGGDLDLTLAAGDRPPACDPRYNAFIDHIVVDPALAATGFVFSEHVYDGERLSDHCPVSVVLPAPAAAN
jgi:endonuclease/exonuclease/phosphatase family metal-dependent hydrolase